MISRNCIKLTKTSEFVDALGNKWVYVNQELGRRHRCVAFVGLLDRGDRTSGWLLARVRFGFSLREEWEPGSDRQFMAPRVKFWHSRCCENLPFVMDDGKFWTLVGRKFQFYNFIKLVKWDCVSPRQFDSTIRRAQWSFLSLVWTTFYSSSVTWW